MPKVTDEYIANKKKEIIDAAYQVCQEKAIESIVLQDITDKAGFSHGAIYRYYKDIDEIFVDLFARLNSEISISVKERYEQILNKTVDWRDTILGVCQILSDAVVDMGIDELKLAAYTDVLIMSNPERAVKISSKLKEDEKNPLIWVEANLRVYIDDLIDEGKVHPTESTDKILQFMGASIRGIEASYVLSKSFADERYTGNYKPDEMFRCLAKSMISMLGGNIE